MNCRSTQAHSAIRTKLLAPALLLCLLLTQPVTAVPALAQSPQAGSLAAALDLADKGYYEDAIKALQALLPSAGLAKHDVLAAMAAAYERLGQWKEAATQWSAAAAASYREQDRAAAIFRWANALQQSGDAAQAARLYRAFLRLSPQTQAKRETLSRIADCYAAAGLWGPAADYYRQALADLAPGSDRVSLVLRLADALVLAGDQAGALVLLASEASQVPDEQVAQFQYRWAQAERAAGKEQDGLARLRSLLLSYPRSPYAYSALMDLLDAGQDVDDYWRGMVDYYAGAYDPAIQALRRYLESDRTESRASALYFLGLALQAAGQESEAAAQFDALITGFPSDSRVADAWLAKGQAQAAAGDESGAIATYQAFVQAFPQHDLAPEALYRVAQIADEAGQAAAAQAAYARVYQLYPAAEQGRAAALRAGLLAAQGNDWSTAEQYFGTAVTLSPGSGEARRYQFWLARAFLANGKVEQARTLLTEVAGGFPRDYYSYRAWVLLQGSDPLANPAGNLLFVTESDRAQAQTWLQQSFDPTWKPGTLPPAVAADSRFRAIQEFLGLGLRDQAIDLALSLGRDVARDPVAAFALAEWLNQAGLYRPSIQIAANIIYTQADSQNSVPRYIWALVYPTYYSDLALAQANASGLDPLLFFSLMRQESLFDPLIGSAAGAQGLGQIMPATGEWIASQLGDSDYKQLDLLRPFVSVRYGAWYLAKQLSYVDGNVLAGLAAYNAGPGNAMKWLKAAGNDPDLFYESVAFGETRRYLDTILANYYQYRRIYAAPQ